jgi:hypothetical protein
MASNYTEHYGLCQWEATDQVLREEFNEDNARIEAALDDVNAQVSVKKLLEYEITEPVTQFDVDVSPIAFEEFGEIKIVAALQSGADVLMRLNGIADKQYGFGDYTSTGGGQGSFSDTYMARFPAENRWACGVLTSIVPAQGRNVIFRNYCIGCSGGGISYSCGTSLSANVQWQQLNTLNFVGTSSIEVGSRVQIWGMR